ncbi:MAG: glycosyltransferase, partial [Ginsengibacter sp.]
MKFCFWGNVSSALNGKTRGGAELQIALLAKSLAMKGHNVVVIDPYVKESFTTNEGIRVINIPDWNKGIRVIRFFFRRIPLLYRLFKAQNADFYYVRMKTYLHIIPYLACRKVNGKFIIGIAHDLDLANFRDRYKYAYSNKFNLLRFITRNLPNDWVFDYLVKKADYLLVQHAGQKSNAQNAKGHVAV